jgi:NADP-dependent alcohol dehydrogenase
MNNFEFYNPVNILFGRDRIRELSNLIPYEAKVMMIYGRGSIIKNGIYKQVTGALKEYDMIEFGGIEPNPSHEKAMEAVAVIRKERRDFLLAVGGGSVIDATKYIAAATYFEGDPWNIVSQDAEITRSIPLGTILTLPATGTEMNANSVISRNSTKEKLAFSSKKVMPLFSILDPTLASSLPTRQVANGIVDSFVHVIEQYLTYPASAPLQDRLAEAILVTLIEEGPKVYANPADYDAMANLMWCSTMALNGIISVGVPEDWSVHMIGHELTALHGIDHARTLAIVLPGVWQTFRKEKEEKLIQYARRVWNIHKGSVDEIIDQAIQRTVDFFESLGIGTRLSAYRINRDSIDLIIQRFKKRNLTTFGDRDMVTPDKAREILECRL